MFDLAFSVLFIICVLAFFSGSPKSQSSQVEPAVEPISQSVLDAVYADPTPDLPSFTPLPDPWKPRFVDCVVPFKRPTKQQVIDLATLTAAEIRKLCHQYDIPCGARGRIGSHVLTQLAQAVA